MSYDNYEQQNNRLQSRDIILASNEFVYIQNKTSGQIRTYTGPTTATISQQESLVVFNEKTKAFQEVSNFNDAKQLCKVIPENWYMILKNPSEENVYPEVGKASTTPTLRVGRKVNIQGPSVFSLFPGQMAHVVRGHALRSNQYLLARVYEAESASESAGKMLNINGEQVEEKASYVNGQMLVIPGTEVSFYIPPTGIEVIPVDNNPQMGYAREAVTLERLEYCILKDENGVKTYHYGPAVVFPKPTETFVTATKGGYIFKAIELSPISGIYVKVIAEYTDENNVVHPVGEELFLTSNSENTRIYYPRPEHAIINYDGKVVHHAIAIPEGEGRYIMNRLNGEITTVTGPMMYLPDPRTEVVVKRKLTKKQCELWYPGNLDVLSYNVSLSEKSVEKNTIKYKGVFEPQFAASTCSTTSLDALEANASISRGTSYTKPRTITIDSKFEGVPNVDVWTGYAVNVISKDGTRKVVVGPKSILLDYDQTLDVLSLSTENPKATGHLESTVFLRCDNNKISDVIRAVTKDFVDVEIKVSYSVSFDIELQNKWFSIENYVKYLCDHCRTIIKNVAKQYAIEEFYSNYVELVNKAIVPEGGLLFNENGMRITECEVSEIAVESEIGQMMMGYQREMVGMALKLSSAEKRIHVSEKFNEAENKEQELRSQQLKNKMDIQRNEAVRKLEIEAEISRLKDIEDRARAEARIQLVDLEDMIADAARARRQADEDQAIAIEKEKANIERTKQETYAKVVADIMASICPEIVAAMNSKSNADMLAAVSEAMSPIAIARGESIAETTNLLLRGTSLEGVINNLVE